MLKVLFELNRRAGYEKGELNNSVIWAFLLLQDKEWRNEFDGEVTLSAFQRVSPAFVEAIETMKRCTELSSLSVDMDFSMILNPCELYYPPATSSLFIIRVVRTNSEEVERGLNMA